MSAQPPSAGAAVTLVTAYSVDYPPGHICAARNRHYAQLHGYGFRCWVDSNLAMCERINRCSALTWCKVHAINDALREAPPDGLVLWIDADALVVRLDVRVEDVHAAHGAPELLVAKDVTPTCLINGGVLCRKSVWAWCGTNNVNYWEYQVDGILNSRTPVLAYSVYSADSNSHIRSTGTWTFQKSV